MSAMPRALRQMILRHAAGYIELAELLVDGDAAPPPSAQKLLARALATIAELPEDHRTLSDASLLQGEALRALGRWEEALTPLARAADTAPGRIESWLGLGWCLKRLGRLDEAIRMLERGRDASPQQPIVLYNLACYHSLAGNVPAAIDHLTQAITLDDRYRDLTGTERDFDPIRSDPRFVAATHVTV
jgi:tetratricopeptide (TPR) repeat protein